jgi:hypothetical protein
VGAEQDAQRGLVNGAHKTSLPHAMFAVKRRVEAALSTPLEAHTPAT